MIRARRIPWKVTSFHKVRDATLVPKHDKTSVGCAEDTSEAALPLLVAVVPPPTEGRTVRSVEEQEKCTRVASHADHCNRLPIR